MTTTLARPVFEMLTDDDEFTLPSGDYFAGDPSFVIPREHWAEFLAAGGCEDGTLVAVSIDGHEIVAISTHGGDGCYVDQGGDMYDVESGRLGLVPMTYLDALGIEAPDGGHVVSLRAPVSCFFSEKDQGAVRLGPIRILTDPENPQEICFACGRDSDSPDFCTYGCDERGYNPDANEDDD